MTVNFYLTPLSITSQRLASMVEHREPKTFQLNVWDRRTGEHFFVRRALACCVQNPDRNPVLGTSCINHRLLGFFDDYQLAVKVKPSSDGVPPYLLLWVCNRIRGTGADLVLRSHVPPVLDLESGSGRVPSLP